MNSSRKSSLRLLPGHRCLGVKAAERAVGVLLCPFSAVWIESHGIGQLF